MARNQRRTGGRSLNAGTTGLLDLVTRSWKRSLLQMAGLRSDILAGKKKPGRCSVTFHRKRLNSATYEAGTPVIVGGGDVRWKLSGTGRRTPGANGRAGRNASGNRWSIFPRRSPTPA